MKKLIVLFSVLILLTSCGWNWNWNWEWKNNGNNYSENNEPKNNNSNNLDDYIIDDSNFEVWKELLKDMEISELNEEEINWLILMREEEKLANDVYETLYEKWNEKIFNNITKSEKVHTAAVWDLLVRYNIEDPIKDHTVWVFTSEKLQKLYNDLVNKGSVSIVEALKVWMMIEDLDIYDLEELSLTTDKEDILLVYSNLTDGSVKHMQAFYKNLNRKWGSYENQFISDERYKEIIWD